jgi:hypothetical protein
MNARLRTAVLLSASLLPGTAIAADPPAPQKCDTPEYRQFDFWVGKWDVFSTKDGTPGGASLIELLYGKCTIRENWTDSSGFSGGSLNTYNRVDKQWHQTWTDSTGSWREFVGGLQSGRMVLVWRHASVTMPGKTVQERMIFTPNADGSVRQYSDQTIDGTTWVERYDYTYRRAKD